MSIRRTYPSDVTDDEWAFVAPYLTLMTQNAPQREHPTREVFNALRWLVRTGSPWRYLPNDLPPWYTVYQQTHRWIAAGCFESLVHDLRELLRLAAGRNAKPSAAIFDGRTLFLMGAPCSPASKAASGQASTATKRSAAPKSTWLWTR